ncbi:response regulator transcription factor [Alkalihalobacillus oceani]|uniref:Response regulator transcription factor n=1 Tax=Halalkalibacter oceani TaxID=1653776 RepID=A0A9X2DQC6_9BACI|nr:response regulator transcription factor [Halalkalibacter oceani]MCM3715119.1 response regulator transcription factor [Halalkalibacter oceani]
MLKAIIIDYDELSVKQVKKKLTMRNEIDICRSFSCLRDAYDYMQTHPIQLAFLNAAMPEVKRLTLSDLLHQPEPAKKATFVTRYEHYTVQIFDLYALDSLMASIVGHRLTNRSPFPKNSYQEKMKLTQKEREVVQLLTEGLSNKQIANQLHVSTETVNSHIKNIYRKLNVHNRIQVFQRARQLNLCE